MFGGPPAMSKTRPPTTMFNSTHHIDVCYAWLQTQFVDTVSTQAASSSNVS